MLPENSKRPMGFRHLGSSPFCEGESQTSKFPLTALFTQQTSVFGFVCSTKQKGLGTNLQNHMLCVLIVAYFPPSSTKQNRAWNEPNFPHSLKHDPDPVKDTHSPAQQAKQKGLTRCILGEISGLPENTCNDHRPQSVFTELRQHAQEGTGMGRNISCPPKDS